MLNQVAEIVNNIEDRDERNNISASIQILAGLRFNQEIISSLFREEIMEESVVYQNILQKGEQKGKQSEALTMIMRPIKRRFGTINPQLESRIRSLSVAKLEDLSEVLFDVSSLADLQSWLDAN
ncbi:MAG TPA: DUF4351 domain-containing protein [Allocoleopsis sp.]